MPPAPTSEGRDRSVEAAFARFLCAQGLEDRARRHPLIEAFCAQGLDGRSSSTKGTYRSVLRKKAGLVLPGERRGYRGAAAKAPYSAAERAELVAVASAQPRRWRGEAALVVLALGIGAGLRTNEIVACRGTDVEEQNAKVVVTVGGRRERRMEVRPPFASVLASLAWRSDTYLFHPTPAERTYPNFVNDIAVTLRADSTAPRLSVGRCRASYICDRLAEGASLRGILEATGIEQVESLLRYALYVEGAPTTKAGLRRRLEVES